MFPGIRCTTVFSGRALNAERIRRWRERLRGPRRNSWCSTGTRRPSSRDLVLLQVTANDFINNQWELERASYSNNNNLAVRPYLVGETAEYRFPSSLGSVRLLLTAHSRVFYETILFVDRLGADLARRGLLRSVEMDIAERGLVFAPFLEAVRTTDAVILRIKRRIGNTPLVVFPADDPAPYSGSGERSCNGTRSSSSRKYPRASERKRPRGIGLRTGGRGALECPWSRRVRESAR